MTETRAFDELVRWHHIQRVGFAQGWDPGWRATDGALADNIARSDPYWGMVLDKARAAYGDPNMRFNTDDPDRDRSLVFGDGTPVPADGTLAYRDAASNRTYLLNTDGSVSPIDANGQVQQPLWPAGWRATDDGKYAPVDTHGQQIAPLLDRMPRPLSDYHDRHGVLTPKNARGEYYVDEGGTRTYFDAAGRPITEEQYRRGATAPGQEGDGAPLDTDEQQSGRAAEAVKKLHEELKNRYSDISDAEGQLSEVLLTARATTAEGQRKLQAVQEKIVAAIDNPALALDTPAGEQAFLKLLREQVSAIGDIVTSGALSAEDQSRAVEALTDLYAVDQRGADESHEASESGGGADDLGGVAAATPPAVTGEPVDLGLGPMEPMPDASLSDLGLDGLGAAVPPSDPLASLASALPAAMGAFPPAAGFGADPLSALGGLAGPLAGLASQLQTPPPSDPVASAEPADPADEDASEGDDEESAATTEDSDTEPPPDPTAAAPPEADTTPADTPEAPPAAVTAPLPPTTVQLPDGSTANAKTAALAEAVRSHLGGTPVEESYRQAGLELPPPGTPVTNPIDPTALSCGSVGMFEDRYVVALSSAKALQDGDVVPLSAVASGPGFLGWMDPSARSADTPAPQVPTPAPPG